MKNRALLSFALLSSFAPLALASSVLEIDIQHEIDLQDGSFLAKEYGGQGRYAYISHNHGRFEGGDIAEAVCSEGFVVSKLPAKFSKIKKALKPTDFVLTECRENQ